MKINLFKITKYQPLNSIVNLDIATNVAGELEAGWIGTNNFQPALAEAPFGEK